MAKRKKKTPARPTVRSRRLAPATYQISPTTQPDDEQKHMLPLHQCGTIQDYNFAYASKEVLGKLNQKLGSLLRVEDKPPSGLLRRGIYWTKIASPKGRKACPIYELLVGQEMFEDQTLSIINARTVDGIVFARVSNVDGLKGWLDEAIGLERNENQLSGFDVSGIKKDDPKYTGLHARFAKANELLNQHQCTAIYCFQHPHPPYDDYNGIFGPEFRAIEIGEWYFYEWVQKVDEEEVTRE